MNELFLSAFVTLFVVIDPPGCAPIYAGLTSGASQRQAVTMAARATLIATLILQGLTSLQALAALQAKAKAEGRDVTVDELAALRAIDLEARATLDAAIAAHGG